MIGVLWQPRWFYLGVSVYMCIITKCLITPITPTMSVYSVYYSTSEYPVYIYIFKHDWSKRRCS